MYMFFIELSAVERGRGEREGERGRERIINEQRDWERERGGRGREGEREKEGERELSTRREIGRERDLITHLMTKCLREREMLKRWSKPNSLNSMLCVYKRRKSGVDT